MGAYAMRRLLWIPVTLLLTTIVVFLLVRFIPGDIVDTIQAQMVDNGGAGAIDRPAIEHALGLDVPVYTQYGRWIGNIVFHGNMGKSLRTQLPITPQIVSRIPITFELGLMGIIVGLLISLPIGVYAAIRQDTITDYILRSIAILLISIPSFWLGTLVVLYASLWWGWTPPMEFISLFKNLPGNMGMMIVPALVLGAAQTGGTMRMTRTMMLEVLRQDYIRTAWSKGLSERVVVLRHAVKNAFIPIVTMIGAGIPSLIGGSVIIEQIFNLPGMGRLMYESLMGRDYPIVSAINLILAVLVVVTNLGVDLTYGWLDPRIHYQ
jgi:peptide/nickel transport system permease protein